MDEQRYVVEITRPVPQDRVEQVAQRIAARLNVPFDRIVTLLEGRTGEVTKPVLADKADAIAEVFAEAGVRVVVAAARIDPPPYEERFGEPPGEPFPPEPDPPHDDPPPPDPYETAPVEESDGPPPWDEAAAWEFGASQDDDFGYVYEPPAAGGAAAEAEAGEREASPLDEATPDEATPDEPAPDEPAPDEAAPDEPAPADGWPTGDASAAEEPDPYGVEEDEADRLGPTPRMRVEVEPKPQGRSGPATVEGEASASRGEYAASTRWTPSPHDPYAFSPEDAATGEERPSPIGPARATPLDAGPAERRAPYEPHSIGGFYSPDDYEAPREGPRLRSYLLWALGISLLVLILLQFVLASRVDGAPAGGSFESGLAAYRLGDFAAARRAWEPLATSGDAQAQYLLGFMAQNGLGQPWSNAGAANWYRQAAHQGHARAQLALGDLYMRGMGVDQDLRAGAAWYASAAVAGDPTGQFEYAKLALHGVGVDRDLAAALAWFEAAAANGSAEAADYVEFGQPAANH